MGRVIVFSFFVIFNASPGLSQDSTSIDLTDFSLEELLDVEVVSISRKAESVQRAAAAVFVISAEDIRRSGAHSIPEVLRLAPGLNVARISSSSWAITSRGFNSRFANKLQVLVDGRSIYSTMFSGVYWEASPVMLEDIERIEIIRGPGATMWGANAVNGVINIITKKPDQDDWSIVPDRLNLILGGKWEYRKDTGDQGQPNVRMTWTPTEKTTWWGSVARAVRVPSRINRDIQMDMAINGIGIETDGWRSIHMVMVVAPASTPNDRLI